MFYDIPVSKTEYNELQLNTFTNNEDLLMFLKEVSSAQGCIYLTKNTVKYVNITIAISYSNFKYYYNFKQLFSM